MLHIWLKAICDNKIIKQQSIKVLMPYSRELFEIEINNLLDKIDLPKPVYIVSHYINFEKFKCVRFNKQDFVESIPYDVIEVSNIS